MSMFEKLREHIISLSESDDFERARNEWELFNVELSEDIEGETCPCGKTGIRELCYIHNIKNGKKIFVGNVCVKKFMHIDTGNFFNGIRKLRETPESNPNFDVIKHAQKFGYLHDNKEGNEYDFLCNIRRKRKLSDKQKRWRAKIVRRILEKIVVSRVKPNNHTES